MTLDDLQRELNVIAVGGAPAYSVEWIASQAMSEIARLREELSAAQQREREALAMLAEVCDGLCVSNDYAVGLGALLSRAREQEVPRG